MISNVVAFGHNIWKVTMARISEKPGFHSCNTQYIFLKSVVDCDFNLATKMANLATLTNTRPSFTHSRCCLIFDGHSTSVKLTLVFYTFTYFTLYFSFGQLYVYKFIIWKNKLYEYGSESIGIKQTKADFTEVEWPTANTGQHQLCVNKAYD